MSALMELLATFEKDVVKVGVGFQKQLQTAIYGDENYLESDYITARLRQASEYFSPRIDALNSIVKQLSAVSPDSTDKKRRLDDITLRLRTITSTIIGALKICNEGFTTEKYHREKARLIAQESQGEGTSTKRSSRKNPTLNLKSDESSEKSKTTATISDITHQKLYDTLALWRLEEAREMKFPPYCVLSNRTLLALQDSLPRTTKELEKVVGMGKVKMKKYSDQLLDIINDYCFNNDIEP